MTTGMTLSRCRMYCWQTSGVRVAQNCLIPFFNCSKFLGLYVLRRYCLRDPHIFSIGFKSGDSGGKGHQLILFSWKNVSIRSLACLGSLSCCRRCPVGNLSLMKGSKPTSNTVSRCWALIIPVKIMMLVAPLADIPPQMCTLTGCFARCFNRHGCLCFLKHKRLWFSNWTVHSSVKITSSNFSITLACSLHHSNLLCLFSLSVHKYYMTNILYLVS